MHVVLGADEPSLAEARQLKSQVLNLNNMLSKRTSLVLPGTSVFVGVVPSPRLRPREYDFVYEAVPGSPKIVVELLAVLTSEEVPPRFRLLQLISAGGSIDTVALYAGPAQAFKA